MINFAKTIGVFLFILVGYHYFNSSLGFSIAGSVAIIVFAFCIISLHKSYSPDRKSWFGWSLIVLGCLLLSIFKEFNFWLMVPLVLIIFGFYLAELSIGSGRSLYGDSGGGFGSSGGDYGGDCGGGDCGGD